MKPKEYKLETIEDIFNCINADNVENFIEGFSASLRGYAIIIKTIRVISTVSLGDKKNTELVGQKSITYIDDNKQENKITIETP